MTVKPQGSTQILILLRFLPEIPKKTLTQHVGLFLGLAAQRPLGIVLHGPSSLGLHGFLSVSGCTLAFHWVWLYMGFSLDGRVSPEALVGSHMSAFVCGLTATSFVKNNRQII